MSPKTTSFPAFKRHADAGLLWASLLAVPLLAGLLLTGSGANAAGTVDTARGNDALAAGFVDPPLQARPRVWWHWMNGNISKEGIRKDLEWMKRVGIGGFQNFDANLVTPQIVDERLVYMTAPWKDAFRYAAGLAAELDLEMAIAASPGWSETGGPWVKPEDGIKKLVWSETLVTGGKPVDGVLARPPSVTGPFQSIGLKGDGLSGISGNKAPEIPQYYDDVAVFAYPVMQAMLAAPVQVSVNGESVAGNVLFDDSLETSVEVVRDAGQQPGTVVMDYGKAVTVRSARFYAPGLGGGFFASPVELQLSASKDGKKWQDLAAVTPDGIPYTVSFAATEARYFRLRFVATGGGGLGLRMSPAPGADMSFLGSFNAKPEGPVTDKLADFRLFAEPKVDHFELKAGFEVALDYYRLDSRDGEHPVGVAPEQVIDLTSRVQPDGSLDWTPPQGQWRIVRLGYSLTGKTNHPAPPEATGLEVDKLDADAVRDYLETYLDMYRDAVGDDLMGERGLRALLTDSTEVHAFNWTPEMPGHFKRLRGYDIAPWLPALTGAVVGSREQTDAFLYDFRRTLAELHASQHYATVAEVAGEYGLKVYGEALEDHRPSLGDDMALRAHADVPMSALWTYSREMGPSPTYLADMRGAASVAHVYGQNLVAAESMTAAFQPWAAAPVDLKRVIDLEFASGINLPVIHTSVHQPLDDKQPGLSLAIFGQYFNRHETWAEMARPWVDYIARNSYMLQQGRFYADVAYFYGEEGPLTGLYGDEPVADAPSRYAYDFVNVDAVMNLLSVDDGELITPAGARYKVLYLGGSSERMTVPVLRRIKALVEAGATVVGLAPEGSPGLKDDADEFRRLVSSLWSGQAVTALGGGRVIAGTDVEAALASLGIAPDFSYSTDNDDSHILFVHRQLDGGDVYFVNNRKNRAETVEARFRVAGKRPELWNPETGAAEALSYRIENGVTTVVLAMKAEDAVHVVFRETTDKPEMTVEAPVYTPVAELSGPWQVGFQPGRGAPESIALDRLVSLSEHDNPGVKYFSGTASYRQSFALPDGVKPGLPLRLDLGDIGDVAEVWVNGKKAGTAWLPPYQVDIGLHVKSGDNRLEIRVVNLWVNRLIGDARPDADKVTWTALPTYKPDAPLRPAGLLGPVKLLVRE